VVRVVAVAALALLSACTEAGGTAGQDPRPSPTQAARSGDTATPDALPPPTPTPSADHADVEVSVVTEDLQAPWALAFTGDRVFVSSSDTGEVLEIGDDGSTTIVHRFEVDKRGDAGLLGLAASPSFETDGWLYAYYSTEQDNRIERFRPDGGPVEEVLTGIPRGNNHQGGGLDFGPDGMLYASTGDSARRELAQRDDSLAGKILRMTPEGDSPEDNPIPETLVYSLGHRNVQGLAWDTRGRLYATEFGPDEDDEINLIVPGGNYGWPEVTGEAGMSEFVDPIFVAQPPEASWSGATILLDGAIPEWEGDLFAAGLRGERLWRLELTEDGTVEDQEELLVNEYGRLRNAAQAPDGSLWVLTSNTDAFGEPGPGDDRILRIAPAPER
jgi:glucose/arabinose dehydrogenase